MRPSALLLLLLGTSAHAAPTIEEAGPHPTGPTTVTELIHDLDARHAGDRKFAARELARRATNLERRRSGESLRALEAAVDWSDLRTDAGEAIVRCLGRSELRRPCARAALALELTQALPALRTALASEPPGRTARLLEDTLQTLESIP